MDGKFIIACIGFVLIILGILIVLVSPSAPDMYDGLKTGGAMIGVGILLSFGLFWLDDKNSRK